jgi:hypothetical protein
MRFSFCFNASVMTEGRPNFSASWTFVRPTVHIMHHFRTLAAFITCSPYTATSLWWISQGLTFSACKNRITPRTSQPAGFDISAFIVSTYHTHNVKKFAAWTTPRNCPHSSGHITWLISYIETTARVVCANVLYVLDAPLICLRSLINMLHVLLLCVTFLRVSVVLLLTCDMYMSDLRHIHDPVLSFLKMEGLRLFYYVFFCFLTASMSVSVILVTRYAVTTIL